MQKRKPDVFLGLSVIVIVGMLLTAFFQSPESNASTRHSAADVSGIYQSGWHNAQR
jgi:hypothetical protein